MRIVPTFSAVQWQKSTVICIFPHHKRAQMCANKYKSMKMHVNVCKCIEVHIKAQKKKKKERKKELALVDKCA